LHGTASSGARAGRLASSYRWDYDRDEGKARTIVVKEKEKRQRDGTGNAGRQRILTAEAERALAEAAERRKASHAASPAKEIDGRDGPDPTRYGDWEVKGIASDF
jgi:hypothetical protein